MATDTVLSLYNHHYRLQMEPEWKEKQWVWKIGFSSASDVVFTQTIKLDDLYRIYYQALQDQEPNEMHDFLQTFHLYQITLQGVRNNHLYFECTMLPKLGGQARSLMFQINYLDRRGELRVIRFNPHLEAENQATDGIPANETHRSFVR